MQRQNVPLSYPAYYQPPRAAVFAPTYQAETYGFNNGQVIHVPQQQPVVGSRMSQFPPAVPGTYGIWGYQPMQTSTYAPQASGMLPMAAAPHPPARKVLDIVDPKTGQKIDLSSVAPQSTKSNQSNDSSQQIRAQFASKVAAVAAPISHNSSKEALQFGSMTVATSEAEEAEHDRIASVVFATVDDHVGSLEPSHVFSSEVKKLEIEEDVLIPAKEEAQSIATSAPEEEEELTPEEEQANVDEQVDISVDKQVSEDSSSSVPVATEPTKVLDVEVNHSIVENTPVSKVVIIAEPHEIPVVAEKIPAVVEKTPAVPEVAVCAVAASIPTAALDTDNDVAAAAGDEAGWKETKRNKKKKKNAKDMPVEQEPKKQNQRAYNNQQQVQTKPPTQQPPVKSSQNQQKQHQVPQVQTTTQPPAVSQPAHAAVESAPELPKQSAAPAKPVPVWPIIKSNLVPAQQPQPAPVVQASKPPQPPSQQQQHQTAAKQQPHGKQPIKPPQQQFNAPKQNQQQQHQAEDGFKAAGGKRRSKEKNKRKEPQRASAEPAVVPAAGQPASPEPTVERAEVKAQTSQKEDHPVVVWPKKPETIATVVKNKQQVETTKKVETVACQENDLTITKKDEVVLLKKEAVTQNAELTHEQVKEVAKEAETVIEEIKVSQSEEKNPIEVARQNIPKVETTEAAVEVVEVAKEEKVVVECEPVIVPMESSVDPEPELIVADKEDGIAADLLKQELVIEENVSQAKEAEEEEATEKNEKSDDEVAVELELQPQEEEFKEKVIESKSEVSEAIEEQMVKEESAAEEEDEIEDDSDQKVIDVPALKYSYTEEQWSPLNPEGKKRYDRSFLLQIQRSATHVKPDLPNLDIVLNEPLLSRQDSQLSNHSGHSDLTPPVDFVGYIRSSQSNSGRNYGGNKRGQGQGQNRGQGHEQRKIELKLQSDVSLHKAEAAWKPVVKTKLSDTEIILSSIKSILNKLTPQKFDVLLSQIKSLPIDSEERLSGCIDILFEKAISEPGYSIAYANMAKCLLTITVPLDSDPSQTLTFRKVLLTKCQMEFEKDKEEEKEIFDLQAKMNDSKTEEEKKQMKEEIDYAISKAKRRSLGNIRFIGELFKLKMLTDKIMHECVRRLLNASSDEDSLECLCQLLTTIGKDLDIEKSKTQVEAYFNDLKNLSVNKKVSTRIRFMILDVIDLRKSGWKPKKGLNPKTIQQIHQEAEQERLEKQQEIAMLPHQPHPRGGRRQDNRQGGLPSAAGNISEDGWMNVSRAPRNQPFDISKMKITKTNVDETIQLGPGGRGFGFAWNRGSMGGGSSATAAKSQEQQPQLVVPANRYSLLSSSMDDGARVFGVNSSMLSSASSERDSYRGRHSGPQGGNRRGNEYGGGYANRQQSQEGPRLPAMSQSSQPIRQQQPVQKPVPPTAEIVKPPMAKEVVERKSKSLIDEFLQLNDMKEALECVKEIDVDVNFSNAVRFFYHSLTHALERSGIIRNQVGSLHRNILKKGLVTSVNCYTVAIQKLARYADDLVIDAPHVWEYVGEIVSPLFLDGSDFKLDILLPSQEVSQGGEDSDVEQSDAEDADDIARVMAVVLHAVSQKLGRHQANELWEKSNLQWGDLVKKQPLEDFIRKFKLEYTVGASSEGQHQQPPRRQRLMSVNENKNELIGLFAKQGTTIEQIHDWIYENMHLTLQDTGNPADLKSVSDCCTALCMSCLSKRPNSTLNEYNLDEERMRKYLYVIKSLTNERQERQLEILFGLQELIHRLSHPPDLLHRLFELLFDAEVLNESAFHQWKEDNTKTAGKGVALSSVSRFYNWLIEEEKDRCE